MKIDSTTQWISKCNKFKHLSSVNCTDHYLRATVQQKIFTKKYSNICRETNQIHIQNGDLM